MSNWGKHGKGGKDKGGPDRKRLPEWERCVAQPRRRGHKARGRPGACANLKQAGTQFLGFF